MITASLIWAAMVLLRPFMLMCIGKKERKEWNSSNTLFLLVTRSYSWSSNICGVKKWTLFPPGQEDLYKDRLGNLVYDIRNVDAEGFPKFALAKRIVIYQKDGETVFVPSGWFHQVKEKNLMLRLCSHIVYFCCRLKTLAGRYRSITTG